jgi:hypothetical protein
MHGLRFKLNLSPLRHAEGSELNIEGCRALFPLTAVCLNPKVNGTIDPASGAIASYSSDFNVEADEL